MAVENDEIFGGHSQAEDGFQDNEPGSPTIECLEPRQSHRTAAGFYRVDYVDLFRHKQKACEQTQRTRGSLQFAHRLFAAAPFERGCHKPCAM
jgi:hypothetical protein